MTTIPEEFLDLLTTPIVAGFATVRPDGQPESSPMWFLWDGTHLRFTHTTNRRKLANIEANPYISLLAIDPNDAHRYLQVRAHVDSIDPDPTGTFFIQLAAHYGRTLTTAPDATARVTITATPIGATYTNNG